MPLHWSNRQSSAYGQGSSDGPELLTGVDSEGPEMHESHFPALSEGQLEMVTEQVIQRMSPRLSAMVASVSSGATSGQQQPSAAMRILQTIYSTRKCKFTCQWLQSQIRRHGMKLLLLLLLLLTTCCLLTPMCSAVAGTDAPAKAKVTYKDRDLMDYHLYYTELVEHHPVFRFANLKSVFSQVSKVPKFNITKPVIFVATSTFTRETQKAALTKMCNPMRHNSNIFWIVIENSLQKSGLVHRFLLHCGIPAVHVHFKIYSEPECAIDQRNAAIGWIKRNTDVSYENSVLYFAEEENTYDPEIFEEMRYTRRVSVWPVGLIGGLWAEGPIVRHGKVRDWASNKWVTERKFPIDMAGFAVNFRFISDKPAAKFRHNLPSGFAETTFLEALGIEDEDLEPRADNCSKVLVWHTRTRLPIDVTGHTKRGSIIPVLVE